MFGGALKVHDDGVCDVSLIGVCNKNNDICECTVYVILDRYH